MYLKRAPPPFANSFVTYAFQSLVDCITARYIKCPLSLEAKAMLKFICIRVARSFSFSILVNVS